MASLMLINGTAPIDVYIYLSMSSLMLINGITPLDVYIYMYMIKFIEWSRKET